MEQVNQEDWLDKELREATPYIDDAGFTARVLQQLPPPRRSRDLLRAAILLGMTLLASVLAYVVSGGGRFVSVTIERQLEADDEPMTHDEMAALFERANTRVPDEASVDIDLRGSDAFA